MLTGVVSGAGPAGRMRKKKRKQEKEKKRFTKEKRECSGANRVSRGDLYRCGQWLGGSLADAKTPEVMAAQSLKLRARGAGGRRGAQITKKNKQRGRAKCIHHGL